MNTKYLLLMILFIGGVILMAHNKVYVTCENMCLEEGMTKEQINETFITSEQLSNELDPIINDLNNSTLRKDGIAVLTGSVTLAANSSSGVSAKTLEYTDKDLSYPEGFTKDNCIVIAFTSTKNEANSGLSFGALDPYSTLNALAGSVPRNATLKSDGINLKFGNYATSSYQITYKLYLLKIS